MSYSTRANYLEPCAVSRVNYFSSPDVVFEGKPTGNALNNNAQCIRDNMVRFLN